MKRSGLLDAINVALARERPKIVKINKQICLDAADMAANDVFHMGPDRSQLFHERFEHYYHSIAEMANGDTEDLLYTKTKMDQRLKQILGKFFRPWKERYK